MQAVSKNRLSVGLRTAGGFALLALLALCGFAGASGTAVQSVSVPVERQTLDIQTQTPETLSVAERLARDRQEEIAMLERVIESADVDQSTRQSALAQKTQLAGRMELEAQARACLAQMGYEGAQVVCGAQVMTVLLPAAAVTDVKDSARVVSAVADQTGTQPQNVKLIFTK